MVAAMNPRTTTMAAGVTMVILGALALFYPQMVMERVLGYAVDQAHSSANFVHGEVRAAYGGLFLVMGIYTLMAALDPAANRARILFVGMLWLGACAGRLFGVFVDGSPGTWGWLSVVFELLVGGALVAVSQMSTPTTARIVPQPVYSPDLGAPPSPSEPPPATPPSTVPLA
jgi:hypothetical protein